GIAQISQFLDPSDFFPQRPVDFRSQARQQFDEAGRLPDPVEEAIQQGHYGQEAQSGADPAGQLAPTPRLDLFVRVHAAPSLCRNCPAENPNEPNMLFYHKNKRIAPGLWDFPEAIPLNSEAGQLSLEDVGLGDVHEPQGLARLLIVDPDFVAGVPGVIRLAQVFIG